MVHVHSSKLGVFAFTCAKNKIYNIDRNNEVAFSDKYDFEDEYLSDNAKKEKKQEISKKSNKRGFKKRNFVPFIIGSLAVALVGTGAYNLGKQKGIKEQEEKKKRAFRKAQKKKK